MWNYAKCCFFSEAYVNISTMIWNIYNEIRP
jgi:hypothetical protein